jgi:hypothetical protein
VCSIHEHPVSEHHEDIAEGSDAVAILAMLTERLS